MIYAGICGFCRMGWKTEKIKKYLQINVLCNIKFANLFYMVIKRKYLAMREEHKPGLKLKYLKHSVKENI